VTTGSGWIEPQSPGRLSVVVDRWAVAATVKTHLRDATLDPGYERVHTVTDYSDGPRTGIADFEGRPHLYESEWDDLADDFAFTFRLSPVEPEVFALAVESWAIWRRWETAFHEGRATKETHPSLPDDRRRSDELTGILELRLKIDESNQVRATGEFKVLDDPEWNHRGFAPLQVKWTRV
jgi:hypothetical protein